MSRVFLCSITCFDADGALDLTAQSALFERAARAGVGLYVGSASPGEGHALRPEETDALLRAAVAAAGGRVSVRAMGVEPRSAAQMIEFLELAGGTGVDAAQIYSLDMGHGGQPTPAELESYFRRAIESTGLPVALSSHMYNGYLVPPEMIERLAADYPHLIAVNATTPDVPYLSELLERVRGRLEVCVGGPMHALTALGMGGDGYLCTEAALIPERCAALGRHFERGEIEKAAAAHADVLRWMRTLGCVSGMSVRRTKAAMTVFGLQGTGLREPHAPLDPAEIETLREALRNAGLRAEVPPDA